MPIRPDFSPVAAVIAGRITGPTLLIRGSESEIVDDDGVAHLRSIVPQLEVSTLGGAGHMVVGQRNDAFGDATLAFLHANRPINGRSDAHATIKSMEDI